MVGSGIFVFFNTMKVKLQWIRKIGIFLKKPNIDDFFTCRKIFIYT